MALQITEKASWTVDKDRRRSIMHKAKVEDVVSEPASAENK